MRKKLKDVCKFYSGTGFPTQYQGQTKGEYPFYKVGDIANNAIAGKIYLELCNNYISSDVAKMIKGCILPKDTVVFAKIGEALKLNRRAITSCDCLIDNNAMGIAPKLDSLRIQYFYFCMKNLKMQTLAESTTVPSVRKTVLEKYEIEVPSLVEQEEIEKKLTLTQKIIEKRRQELSYLDEIIKARFVELFGSIREERLLGEISEFVTVGIANSATHAYAESGIPMLRNQNIKENYLDDSDLIYIKPEFAAKYKAKNLKENDIIVMRTGYPGVACLVPKKYEGCQTFTTLIVRIKPDNNPNYVCVYINSGFGKQFINSEKVGVAQQNVGAKSLAKMPIKIAPKELQNQFADFVAQVNKSKFDTMTFAPIYAIINLYLHTHFYQGRQMSKHDRIT